MIDVEALHTTFGEGTPLETRALRGIDLHIAEGQFVTVIGSNGAGKSTFLNVLAGGAPATSGRVRIDRADVTDWPTSRRARLVSRVFQDPKMGTCEDLSIMENFALAAGRTRPKGFRFAVDRAMRNEVADRVAQLNLGLENRLSDKVGLLSGGQRQSLSLLMATTGETKVLLLDEHTAALDPATAEFVVALTDEAVRSRELTTVMVTHSMQQAVEHGDRLVMFHQGKLALDVDGEERAGMDVADLLSLFKKQVGEALSDDSLLME